MRAGERERVLGCVSTINRSNRCRKGPELGNLSEENTNDMYTQLVRCSMARLGPAMSSIFMVVHLPVGSALQPMVQSPPSLKTVPGVGAFGVGIANAVMMGNDAKRIAFNMTVCDAE